MAESNKYEDVLKKYNTSLTDKDVKEALLKIAEKEKENMNKDVFKTIYSLIDLTSLNTTDTKESIYKFVEGVNQKDGANDIPNVAAICVYPNMVETVKETLTADVNIASVAGGFPHAQTYIEVKVAECALAVATGANEIDIVIDLGKYYDGNIQEMCEDMQEMKEAIRDAHLKVILEIGAQKTLEDVVKTSIYSLYCGADFIKTSTGKVYQGATPEAAYAMCYALQQYSKETGERAGIKISGGVQTPEDAIKYYTIVKEMLGEEYLNNSLFRIGASSLAVNLEKVIEA